MKAMRTIDIKNKTLKWAGIACLGLVIVSCKNLQLTTRIENPRLPSGYGIGTDTLNSGKVQWRNFFKDPNLIALIDTALRNNQELNITLQEIEMSRNEIMARKGEYMPFVGAGTGAGVEKVGRYTSQGANDALTPIAPKRSNTPEYLPDLLLGLQSSWEVDIWHKLRNAREAAIKNYLATVEGKNFMVTQLISEIAENYYELLALDNQLEIVQQNIDIQSNALKIVKMEKEATRVTELAVRKFEAEVFYTRSLQYNIQQRIVEAENRINFLVGRYPQKVSRTLQTFTEIKMDTLNVGVPSQLLQNRTDIRRAEQNLAASKLDVKVAKARFYPSLTLRAGIGLNAFSPAYFIKAPESMLLNLAGDMVAPLVNKNAIRALYYNANAKQIQSVYAYEQSILNAYIEVSNLLARIDNLSQSYSLKNQQVEALNQSIKIATNLFKSAKADYMEVLLTQRDALESKFDLVETKMEQLNAVIRMYKALGGGWE